MMHRKEMKPKALANLFLILVALGAAVIATFILLLATNDYGFYFWCVMPIIWMPFISSQIVIRNNEKEIKQ